MANDKLSELSMEFGVEIINLVKQLKEQRESIISNQMLIYDFYHGLKLLGEHNKKAYFVYQTN